MGRNRANEYLIHWKLCIPATLAGRIEMALFDRITGKPKYGSRNKLVVALLESWLAEQTGREPPHVPSLHELRML